MKVGETTRRIAGAVAVGIVLGASIGVFAAYGSPPTLARHAYHSFVSTPSGRSDLNGRLFTLSNDGRIVLWHAALDDFEAHRVVGSGAGSFGRWWLAHRTTAYFVEDAHNLYVQTLAEGGVVGFGLLAALLGMPLVAAVRARRHPLVAPAFGAYVAFLVHAAVDWDWQMPAVTLLAFFVAAAIDCCRSRWRAPGIGDAGSRGARWARCGRRPCRVRWADREHRACERRARNPERVRPQGDHERIESSQLGAVVGGSAQSARGEPGTRRPETRRAGHASAVGGEGSGRLANLVRHRRRHLGSRAPSGPGACAIPESVRARARRRRASPMSRCKGLGLGSGRGV